MQSRVSSAITWLYDLRSVPRLLPTHSQDKLPGLNVQPLIQTEDGQGTWGLHMLGKCPTTRMYQVTSTKVESNWHPKNTLIWGFNPQSLISTVLSRWKLKSRWYVEAGRWLIRFRYGHDSGATAVESWVASEECSQRPETDTCVPYLFLCGALQLSPNSACKMIITRKGPWTLRLWINKPN